MTTAEPVLEMRGISKGFPGVRALDGVDFRLFPGEVHALLGENGAGKSTLIKVLTGVHPIDEGEVLLRGRPLEVSSPADAQAKGISTVYQEVNLCPNLSVAENIFIGREPQRWGLVDGRAMRRRARELLERLHLDIDASSPLTAHSLAVQQLVAIARALDVEAAVLILDEPTSSLDKGEVAELFRIVRELREEGVAILFVTHFLDQVYEIADRLTVLRNGRLVGEHRTAEMPRLDLVRAMIGKDLATLDEIDQQTDAEAQDAQALVPLLQASGLGRAGAIQPFDLTVHQGEVVGLAGLLGSGRTELARLLFGADRADTGTVTIDGVPRQLRHPRSAIDGGVAFLSENRKAEGLVEALTVRANIVLALQAARGWMRPVPRRRQDEIVARYIEALGIVPADPDAVVANLSGGNQQKVLLARWLVTAPRLLILDEPTRGIDIGAKAEVQRLVARLAEDGTAVVFVSTELEEVLRLSHRIAVLRDRVKVATLDNTDLSTGDLMAAIAGEAAR